MRDIIWI